MHKSLEGWGGAWGEKRKESARLYRDDFNKGYQRKLGKFIISTKGKMENAE